MRRLLTLRSDRDPATPPASTTEPDWPPRARALLAIVLLGATGLVACNSLTGIEQLRLDHSQQGQGGRGEDTSGEGAAEPTGTGGSPAHGGSDTGGSSTTSSETDTPTTTPTVTTTTSSTTTTTTTTTTTSNPVDCQYPDGGFGIYEGSVVNGNLAWQGYADGAAQAGTVSIQDYFDCDGSKGIHAILIDSSAVWCGVCQEEAADLPSQQALFQSKGVRVLTLMVENNSGNPATLSTATSWRTNFGLEMYAVAADPNFTFAGNGSVGLPLQIIVDPRTMKIVAREEGFGGYSTVLDLAAQNAN